MTGADDFDVKDFGYQHYYDNTNSGISQERIIHMPYTNNQIADIITDAVIRTNWKNVSFTRDRQGVSVIFSNLFLESAEARRKSEFYEKFTCYFDYKGPRYSLWEEDKETTEMTEDEWIAEVEKRFSDICGTHLKVKENIA